MAFRFDIFGNGMLNGNARLVEYCRAARHPVDQF